MTTFRLGDKSDFSFEGASLPLRKLVTITRKGDANKERVTLSNSGGVFCLPDSFMGGIEFIGGEFAIGVVIEGFGHEEGVFGLDWNDLLSAYKKAGFIESDEEPMIESKWFDNLYDAFTDYVIDKICS